MQQKLGDEILRLENMAYQEKNKVGFYLMLNFSHVWAQIKAVAENFNIVQKCHKRGPDPRS